MNLSKIWEGKKRPTISFEFFPAKDEKGAQKLESVIDKLTVLKPDFVSVTFGAGGSTRKGSYDLIKKLKTEKQQRVIPYLAAYGLNCHNISSIVKNYTAIPIDGLLCVRGDTPQEADETAGQPGDFPHATDLLSFISPKNDLMLGAAAYPEGHREAANLDKDLEFIKMKVDKGAQFIICQYTYNNNFHLDFIEKCRQRQINVPIIIGIMPIYGIKMMENLAVLCGATIPDQLKTILADLPQDDKNVVSAFGIEFAQQQCSDLLKHGIDGLHFYTMNRAKSVTAIITRLKQEGIL